MKKLIMTSITAAVVIVVLAGTLIPILDDATATTKTFTNDGIFNYGIFGTTDSYTLVFDSTDGSITVNGTIVTPISGVSTTSHAAYSVVASDDFLFRYSSSTAGAYYIQIVGLDSTDTTVLLGCTAVTATIENGALSVTYSTSGVTDATKTFNFTTLYGIVPTSDDAVLKATSDPVYINGDSDLYASGLTTVTTYSNMFHFEGSYEDGITISSPNLSGATFDNIEWNIEEVDGYEDLYSLSSVEFDIIYNDTTVHAMYSYFAVPTEVTAEKTVHFTDGENAILNAIPVIVIVALLLAVVAIVLRSRMD